MVATLQMVDLSVAEKGRMGVNRAAARVSDGYFVTISVVKNEDRLSYTTMFLGCATVLLMCPAGGYHVHMCMIVLIQWLSTPGCCTCNRVSNVCTIAISS